MKPFPLRHLSDKQLEKLKKANKDRILAADSVRLTSIIDDEEIHRKKKRYIEEQVRQTAELRALLERLKVVL